MTYSFAAVTIAIAVIITATVYVESGASTSNSSSTSSIVQDLWAFHTLHVARPFTLEPHHFLPHPAEPLKAADQT
jgi:hypothetical protein